MKKSLLGSSGMLLVALASGCSKPYSSPEAMITRLDAAAAGSEEASACSPLAGPLDGRIGSVAPLTGSCSQDPEDQSLSYQWSLVDAPSGSRSSLDHADLVTPSFVPDSAGAYRLQLIVSNGVLTSAPAQAEILVNSCGDRAPVAVPTASAMSPSTGQNVQLDVGVTDEDTLTDCAAHGDAFEYTWSFVELPPGSAAQLNDSRVHDPSFTPDVPGTYTLRIRVADPTSKISEVREIQLEAAACGDHAPLITSIDSSPSAAPATGQAVLVSPSFSDADVEPGCEAHAPVFSYAWQLEGLPIGSEATLNQDQTQSPSFTPDVPGDYQLRVMITDPTGRSATQLTTITVGSCGTNRPVATAVASTSSASPNDPIQLQGAATDADGDSACSLNQSLSYTWRWVGVPAGSDTLLSNPNAELTGFHPDVPGTYVAELVVTDSSGLRSDPVQVEVSVDSCGTARPIAAAEKVGPGTAVSCDGTPIAVNLGGTSEVLLDAAASTDPDNGSCGLEQTMFYSWTLLTTPLGGGGARLRNAEGRTTVLDTGDNGEYRVRLLVTDSTGLVSKEAICILDLSNAG